MKKAFVAVAAGAVLFVSEPSRAERINIDDVVRLTLSSSPELTAQRSRAQASDHRNSGALGRMLPSLHVSDQYQHWDSPFEIVAAAPGAPPGAAVRVRDQDTNTLTVMATQPLLGLLRRSEEYKASGADAEAAALGVRANESAVREAVELEYLRMFEARARADVAASSERDLTSELAETEARVKAGTQTNADLLRVRVAVSNAHQEGILASADATVSRASLLSAMGRSPDDATTEFEPPTRLLSAKDPASASASEVLSRRPELRQAKLRAESADHAEQSRLYALLPEVNVDVAYSRVDGQVFMPKNSGFVGLRADWAVWEWGSSLAEKKAAAAEARASVADADATQRRILTDVTSRRAELVAATNAVKVAEETIASAEEAYRVTGELVRAGSGTTTDLLSAQSALVGSRLMLERARYARAMVRIRLERAMGHR
jgi:outer membrane protein TolC